MNTIKRTPAQVNDRIKTWMHDTHKYKNQMNFTGIKQDDNIYAIDQESFRDSKNVYVDDNQRLVSRPSLQTEPLPDPIVLTYGGSETSVIPSTYRLVDIKDFGSGKIYISQATNLIGTDTMYRYAIVAYPNTSITLSTDATFILNDSEHPIYKYHIATIEHYVICFNNVNAKILDTDHWDKGWQNFTDFAEVPVLKIVSESGVKEGEINQFIPNKYKEDYIVTNINQPTLPIGTPTDTTVRSKLGKFEVPNLNNVNDYLEYRLGAPINSSLKTELGNDWYHNLSNFIISCAHEVVCIACDKYFYYSANYGSAFEKVYYPEYRGDFLNIAEVSKDGNYFFFVCTEGVFRCELGSKTWSYPFRRNDTVNNQQADMLGTRDDLTFADWANSSYKTCVRACFLTGNIFCFELYDFANETIYLYFKGPGLRMTNSPYADHMVQSTNPLPTDDYYYLDYVTQTLAWGNITNPTSLYDIWTMCSNSRVGFINQSLEYNITLSTDINNKEIAIITAMFNNRVNQHNSSNYYIPANILYIIGGDTSNISSSNYMLVMYQSLSSFAQPGMTPFSITYGVIQSSIFDKVNSRLYLTIDGEDQNTQRIYNLNFNIVLTANTWLAGDFTYNSLALSTTYKNLLPFGQVYLTTKSDYITIGTTTYYYPKVKILNSSNGSWLNEEYDTIFFGFITCYTDDIFYVNEDDALLPDALSAYNYDYKIWSNHLSESDSITLEYTIGSVDNYTDVPEVTYSDTELYLGIGNKLQITYNTKDPDDLTKTLFNLPAINNQSFIDNITGMINISTTEVALFFEKKIVICSKVADENLAQGFRYDYYNTKLSTGIRLGDSVINTLEGSFTIFPTLRGLAAMNYQAFMATTDQVITYLTDIVKEMWTQFFYDSQDNGGQIKIMQWRSRIVLTNNTNTMLIYDLEHQAWWRWEVPANTLIALTDQTLLRIIENNTGDANGNTQKIFKLLTDAYYDYSEDGDFSHPIEWFALSQPIHFNAPNYYKNIKQLVFQMQDSDGTNGKEQKTMDAQIRLFRKKITTREPETVAFKIDEYRTFVKRFNYWKINELQWCLSQDEHTAKPFRLELNGISIKYELGEEVR